MWPSAHSRTVSKRRCAIGAIDPRRSKSVPWIADATMALSVVQTMLACADTSTYCASPVRCMRACATRAAVAASTEACCQTCGTLSRIGARSRVPWRHPAPIALALGAGDFVPKEAVLRRARHCAVAYATIDFRFNVKLLQTE